MHLIILPIKSDGEARQELEEIAVGPAALSRLIPKMRHLVVRVEGISCPAANVLKQEILALGGDAAVGQGVVECRLPEAQAILMGTVKQLLALSRRLAKQPYGLKQVGKELSRILSGLSGADLVLRCGDRRLDLNARSHLLGLITIRPGQRFSPEELASQGLDLQSGGVDIIEIRIEGLVTSQEEEALFVPVVERLREKVDVPISVHTSRREVAEAVLEAGAQVINDLTGLGWDPGLAHAIAARDAALIVGSSWSDFLQIGPSLEESLAHAVRAGIGQGSLIIYPGSGAGTVLRRLAQFASLGKPILVGPFDSPGQRHDLEEAYAAAAVGILNGAKIIAAYHVAEMKKLVTAIDSIQRGKG